MDKPKVCRGVLVVEDDCSTRAGIVAVLEDEGYEVGEAGNGLEALEWLRANQNPCVILLDVRMPVMDGLEFREELKQDRTRADIPIVVLSALDRGLAAKLGTERLLCKPFDLEDLLTTVDAYCS